MKYKKNISTFIFLLFFVLSITLTPSIASPVFIDQIGTRGVNGLENGQFESPKGILVVDNRLWVADSGNNRIQIFGMDGTYIDQFGKSGYQENQFWEPTGMDTNGTHIGIVEYRNERVQIFDAVNNSVAIVGESGSLNGQFNYPTDIAFGDDVFYVSDSSNSRVQVFNQSGNDYLFKFGEGSGYENLQYPGGMDLYNNKLYVVDVSNATVKVFNPKGDLISYFGGYGYGLDSLLNPIDIQVVNGYSIVSDAGSNSVKIFDEKGKFVDQIVNGISDYPEMLEATDTHIYVSNLFEHTVNIYQTVEAPTNVLATMGIGSITIRWEDNADPGVSKAEKFRIFRNDGTGFQFLTETTDYNYIDITVKNNMTYSYQVQSISPIGVSEKATSNKLFLNPPSVEISPNGNITLNTTITEGFQVPLSWNSLILPFIAILIIKKLIRNKQ